MNEDYEQDQDSNEESSDNQKSSQIIPREPFTREDLKNQQLLREVSFRRDLLDSVEKALLYQRCKRELRIIINNYFRDNRLLTNLPATDKNGNTLAFGNGVFASYNDLEHDLIYLIAACRPSDVRNPDFVGIVNGILTHFRPTVYRSIGKNRERTLNPQNVLRQEQSIETFTNSPQMMNPGQQQAPPKKGFLSFLGGN